MKNICALVFVILLGSACGVPDAAVDPDEYAADLEEWKEQRLERLRGPDGYLNLAGLFWLENGTLSIGSDAANDIVFPASAAPRIGELRVTDGGVELNVAPGVSVLVDDVEVSAVLLAEDTTGAPVTASHGSLAWMIIKRDDRFALRLRDFEHPALASFPSIEYFPIDLDLRVAGTFRRFAEPKVVDVDTVIEGLGWHPESPGVVEFELDGQVLSLEAYASGEQLFFVFGDQSSGRETYPAGRFLYADMPSGGETIWLDFNRAYNPPCAFNDFATCPVASPQNRLPVFIAAGEKYSAAFHSLAE